jgi:hypothetical protein
MAGDLAEEVDISKREGSFDLVDAVGKIENLQPGKYVVVGGTANDKGSYERLVKRAEKLIGEGLGFLVLSDKNFRQLVIYRRAA